MRKSISKCPEVLHHIQANLRQSKTLQDFEQQGFFDSNHKEVPQQPHWYYK